MVHKPLIPKLYNPLVKHEQGENSMNKNPKQDRKTPITLIMLISLILGLVIGITLGVELYQTVSIKLGFWKGTVEATHIVILSLRHQIQSSDRIRTTIGLGNTGGSTISCNCTLYYKTSADQDLATYTFNATINTGQTYSRTFLVQSINVSRWLGTDTSIFEY
jgi:hypothetical protein